MSFQIENYSFANKNITLSHQKALDDKSHTFTILTGKNGVGKSRLLVSLVSNFLTKKDSNLNKVLAVSNIKNDKFPIKREKLNNYHYIGSRLSNNYQQNDRFIVFSNLICNKNLNINSVNHVFNYMDFDTNISIDFLKNKSALFYNNNNFITKYMEIYENYYELFNSGYLPSIYSDGFKDFFKLIHNSRNKYYSNDISIKNESMLSTLRNILFDEKVKTQDLITNNFNENQSIYNKIIPSDHFNKGQMDFLDCLFKIHSQGKIIGKSLFLKTIHIVFETDSLKNLKNIKFDLRSDFKSIEQENIIFMLDYGIIRPINVILNKKMSSNKIKFFDLSSGQQSLFSIFLGISGVIDDNSLICIDEPEINLHPEWQNEFIVKLQEIFNHIKSCHFILATHSPQIVAGLTSKKGFVVDLENNITYSSTDYSKKSSDYQLAQIFGYPGHNNEYLIRIALTLLSKISKNINLNENDRENLSLLNKSINDLPENDPVLFIIEQINSLVE